MAEREGTNLRPARRPRIARTDDVAGRDRTIARAARTAFSQSVAADGMRAWLPTLSPTPRGMAAGSLFGMSVGSGARAPAAPSVYVVSLPSRRAAGVSSGASGGSASCNSAMGSVWVSNRTAAGRL